MRKILLAVLMAFTIDAQAQGAFLSGNSFFRFSEAEQMTYVLGISDAISVLETNHIRTVCVPVPTISPQLHKTVKQYLSNHPELLHYSAASNVLVAFREAFPCKK